MGVSVEHAEKVWHDAKGAVKKGKRQGSWYWGKVVNTFKRMMGIQKESMTFKDFQDLQAELLEEEKRITLPPLARELPKTIMVGRGGYYLTVEDIRPTKVYFEVGRLMDDKRPDLRLVIGLNVYPGHGSKRRFLVQLTGPATSELTWEQRSRWVDLPNHPLSVEYLKAFMQQVLNAAGLLIEEKKEGGVKKSYLKGLNAAEKKEMKQEIKRFSKMDSKDKAAYPDDWTADQKYKERLKRKGKKLPKSSHTSEYHRRYGK